jgi:putative Holliday junction resolvase
LAIDYGSKNVGLACSDELRVTVRPLQSVPNKGRKDLVRRLSETIERLEIGEVVVGLPWNMDGSAGTAVSQVESFISSLAKVLNLPLQRVDERLSTAEAEEVWNEMTPRQQKRYRTVDSLAAAMILKRFLEEA